MSSFLKMFPNFRSKSAASIIEAYESVYSMEGYAQAVYRSNWKDAADAAFFHVIENYDDTKGNLEHYSTKVLGKILLSKNKKEMASDEVTQTESDKKEWKRITQNGYEGEDDKSSDLVSCINEMSEMFIKDYKLFTTLSGKYRKESYSHIFMKYELSTIKDAIKYLVDTYGERIGRLYELSKTCYVKNFKKDRIEKGYDNQVEYCCTINGTVIYKKKASVKDRYFYLLDIKKNIRGIIDRFYIQGHPGVEVVNGLHAFCSISGEVLVGLDSLIESLERSLIGLVLARSSLKVVKYVESEELLLCSSSELNYSVVVDVFGEMVEVELDAVPSKKWKS